MIDVFIKKMLIKIISLLLIVYKSSTEDKIWKIEEALVSLFRRTPAPPVYVINDILYDKCENLPFITKFPKKSVYYIGKFGKHWDQLEEQLKRDKKLRDEQLKMKRKNSLQTSTKPVPTNETDYILYSKWRFLKEPPFSTIINLFKKN